MHEREAGGAVGRVDEPPRRERRQPELVHAAFGGEPAVHDRERALGVGARDRRRQREVRAQPVVARAVVELVRDAEEPLAGAELERRADGDRHGLVAARACTTASSPTACAGPRVVGVDLHARAHRTALERGDAHRVGLRRRRDRRRAASSCRCRRRHRRRRAGRARRRAGRRSVSIVYVPSAGSTSTRRCSFASAVSSARHGARRRFAVAARVDGREARPAEARRSRRCRTARAAPARRAGAAASCGPRRRARAAARAARRGRGARRRARPRAARSRARRRRVGRSRTT